MRKELVLTELRESQSLHNLMRAFAGESQARNRYTFAAAEAKKQKLHCLYEVFLYTAGQEKEHGEIFFNHIRQAGLSSVEIAGGYPVDLKTDALSLLQTAQHNELEEFEDAYPAFAATAEQEGFTQIAGQFQQIAAIEKTHADRFAMFARYLQENRLFVSEVDTGWVCLNCGFVIHGRQAPAQCPVCSHEQGYFIRLELAPYTG